MSTGVKILVVVDMQKDFVDGALGSPEAVAILPKVVSKIEEYKAMDGVILATLDTHADNYMETSEGKNLPVAHCIKGSEGWKLHPTVAAVLPESTRVLEKPTFGSTELVKVVGEYVAQYGEENVSVELIGICTDICVVSNALLLKANFYEMPLSLDSACCAGVTPESHNAALTTMKMCQIAVK